MKTKKTLVLILVALAVMLSGCFFSEEADQEHFKNARAYIARGYHGAAAVELKKALNLNPTDMPALLLLDEITTGPKRYKELLPFLIKSQQAGLSDIRISFLLTKAYLKDERFQKALDQIESIKSASNTNNPDKTKLTLLEAETLIGLGKFTEAESIYSQLLNNPDNRHDAQIGLARLSIQKTKQSIPFHPAYFNTTLPGEQYLLELPLRSEHIYLSQDMKDQLVKGDTSIQKLLLQTPQDLEANLLQAEIFYLRGLFTQSIKVGNHCLDLDGRNIQALFLLAKANISLGYYQAAKHDLIQLLAIESSHLLASNTLASIYLRQGHANDAENILKPFIKQALKNEDLYINLGISHSLENDSKKSLGYFKLAVDLFPNSAFAHAQLGTAYLRHDEHQLAINEYRNAHLNDLNNLEISQGLIDTYLMSGKFKPALRIARTLPGQYPESPSTYHILGLLYEHQGEIERARTKYNQAISNNPRYFPSRIRLARILNNEDQSAAAESLLFDGLVLDPNHIELSTEIALLEDQKGQYQDAIERLYSVSKKNPEEPLPKVVLGQLYLKNGNLNKALEMKRILSRVEPLPIEAVQFIGDTYLELGNSALAVTMYKSLVKKMPGNPYHQLNLGRALIKNGSVNTARIHLQKAIDVFGEHSSPALISLAELDIQQNDIKSARKNIKRILKTKLDLTEGYLLYGDLLVRENKIDKAISIYSKAIKSSKKIEAIKRISLAYLQSVKKKDADAFLNEWSKKLPNNPAISLLYINYYFQLSQSEDSSQAKNVTLALKEARRFIQIQPDNGLILNKLALLSLHSNKSVAWGYAQKAHAIIPESPQVLDTYGSICLQKGRQAEGLEALEQAVFGAPTVPSYQYHFAKGLNEIGESNSAKKLLELALSNQSPFKERDEAKRMLAKM